MEQTALITGASAGLGEEFARQLARRGGTLVLVARRMERLEALRQEFAAQYPDLVVYCEQADLSVTEEVSRLCDRLDDKGLKITLLVNNAGLGDHGRFESARWERIRAMIEVNISAPTQLAHHVIRTMRGQGGGAILNVVSIMGVLPLPDMSVYAASKAYAMSLSEAIRAELWGSGITVTALCPGPVDTEFGKLAGREGEEDRLVAPDFAKISKERVVREALEGLRRNRARVIPGLRIAVFMIAVASLPLFLLRLILNRR